MVINSNYDNCVVKCSQRAPTFFPTSLNEFYKTHLYNLTLNAACIYASKFRALKHIRKLRVLLNSDSESYCYH